MLWLCLHFVRLPIESLSGAETAEHPLVISHANAVMQANAPAIQAGIRPGMAIAAARAISDGLRECDYCGDREARMLEQLATWAVQFTSRVSLQPPRALLLEIGASLAYFDGLESLRQGLRNSLANIGHQATAAIAPTPTAAWLLARQGDTAPVITRAELGERLARIPVAALDLEPARQNAIHGLGCTTLGDLRAIPADGLAKRLGRHLLATLQRAHGERADPRVDWQPPPRFQARIELPAETTHSDRLRPGFEHLLGVLCGQLRYREAGVTRILCELHHPSHSPTRLRVGMSRPGRDPHHLGMLLDQQLEQCRLTTGVIALTLKADTFHALAPAPRDLLDDGQQATPDDAWHQLIDNLSNRLGPDRVRALAVDDEHRPERAWRFTDPGRNRANDPPALPPRPAWLLGQPVRLISRGGQPHHHGPLILEHGPERIESGWWDGQDVSRDYYQAITPAGERLWVFRERRGERRWYLHGLFA